MLWLNMLSMFLAASTKSELGYFCLQAQSSYQINNVLFFNFMAIIADCDGLFRKADRNSQDAVRGAQDVFDIHGAAGTRNSLNPEYDLVFFFHHRYHCRLQDMQG